MLRAIPAVLVHCGTGRRHLWVGKSLGFCVHAISCAFCSPPGHPAHTPVSPCSAHVLPAYWTLFHYEEVPSGEQTSKASSDSFSSTHNCSNASKAPVRSRKCCPSKGKNWFWRRPVVLAGTGAHIVLFCILHSCTSVVQIDNNCAYH